VTAVLVLLGLLSLGTLASRRGFAAFVFSQVSTPILLGVGMLCAPNALNLLNDDTLGALEPALRVGAAWLALLIGARGMQPRLSRSYLQRGWSALLAAVYTWAGLALVTYGMIFLLDRTQQGFDATTTRLNAVGAAVLLGGLTAQTGLGMTCEALANLAPHRSHRVLRFLCRHDEAAGAIALCLALWLWPLPEQAGLYKESWQAAIGVVVLGLGFGVVHHVVARGAEDMRVRVVGLIGMVILLAGVALDLRLPEAAIAFFFGVTLGMSGQGQKLLSHGLGRTERPVRMVLLVLLGAQLKFTVAAVLLGFLVAITRMLLKVGLRNAFLDDNDDPQKTLPLRALIPAGGTAVPFALSFALSRGNALATSEILTAVAIAVTVTEVVTMLDWRLSGASSHFDAIDVVTLDASAPPTIDDEGGAA